MNKVRILIVEDEGIVAEDLRFTLVGLGYDVIGIIDTGEKAVEKVVALAPDLILMDIMLAGEMDGIAAADRIHSKKDIPVIYVTAFADETLLARAKLTGPFGYILKPFNEREVQSNIEIALYRHQMEQEIRKRDAILLALGFGIEWFLRQMGEYYRIIPGNRVAPAREECFPILEQMGNAMDLSRIALFRCVDQNTANPFFLLESEWADAAGSPMSTSHDYRNMGKEAIGISPGDLRELKRGNPVIRGREGPSGENGLAHLAPELVSSAILPLMVADSFWGFILFGSSGERTWGGEEVEAMKVGSFIIAGAIGLLESAKKSP
ncbi:MAG: response regulator [Methanoregulaceae archaeon]